MKRTIQFGLIAVGGFLLAGCGKDGKGVSQRIEMPALMSTWASKCGGSELLDVSARTLYKFAGTNVKQVYELHNNGTCQAPLVRVTHDGDFELKGDSPVAAGTKNVDIQFKKITVVALNADGEKLLEKATGFCDVKDWAVNVPVDVTAKAGGVTCPITSAPRLEFDLLNVQNDALYFGKAKLFDNRSKPSERPVKLNMDKPYYKADVKVD